MKPWNKIKWQKANAILANKPFSDLFKEKELGMIIEPAFVEHGELDQARHWAKAWKRAAKKYYRYALDKLVEKLYENLVVREAAEQTMNARRWARAWKEGAKYMKDRNKNWEQSYFEAVTKIVKLRAALEAIIQRELEGWGKDDAHRDAVDMSNIAREALSEP